MRAAALAALLATAVPIAAAAEPRPLRHDPATDGAIAATAAVLYLSSELAKQTLAPSSCRLCEPNGFDAGARDTLVWERGDRARHASDALAALVPAGMLAHQLLAARGAGDTGAGWVDALIVIETAALAMDLNQLVKFSVGRQRPFVRYGNSPEGAARAPEADDNLSFYSGHTTFTFAVAAAAGTVSDLRGYRSAPWVWGVGMGLAAATGYLRIAADRHYLTDVLVGAALGTAAGVALPRLLHGRDDDAAPRAAVSVVPVGFALAF
jgi:membrane-associated phospholipid phosphatase